MRYNSRSWPLKGKLCPSRNWCPVLCGAAVPARCLAPELCGKSRFEATLSPKQTIVVRSAPQTRSFRICSLNIKQAQLLDEGDLQPNGHPAHGVDATGVDSKEVRDSVIVVSIQASGMNFLSVVSSAPDNQGKDVYNQMMRMINSIRRRRVEPENDL